MYSTQFEPTKLMSTENILLFIFKLKPIPSTLRSKTYRRQRELVKSILNQNLHTLPIKIIYATRRGTIYKKSTWSPHFILRLILPDAAPRGLRRHDNRVIHQGLIIEFRLEGMGLFRETRFPLSARLMDHLFYLNG